MKKYDASGITIVHRVSEEVRKIVDKKDSLFYLDDETVIPTYTVNDNWIVYLQRKD